MLLSKALGLGPVLLVKKGAECVLESLAPNWDFLLEGQQD